jgi:hypothetical protein
VRSCVSLLIRAARQAQAVCSYLLTHYHLLHSKFKYFEHTQVAKLNDHAVFTLNKDIGGCLGGLGHQACSIALGCQTCIALSGSVLSYLFRSVLERHCYLRLVDF